MKSSIIVLRDGDETTLHVSKLSTKKAAKAIAARFHHYSTDKETTTVTDRGNGSQRDPWRKVVVLTNKNAADGSGPDHDLASVLEFTLENMAWALRQADQEVPDALDWIAI